MFHVSLIFNTIIIYSKCWITYNDMQPGISYTGSTTCKIFHNMIKEILCVLQSHVKAFNNFNYNLTTAAPPPPKKKLSIAATHHFSFILTSSNFGFPCFTTIQSHTFLHQLFSCSRMNGSIHWKDRKSNKWFTEWIILRILFNLILHVLQFDNVI